MRQGCPETHMRHASNATCIRQHPDDASRSLIAGWHEIKLLHELRIGRKSGKRHRSGVQDFVQVCSQGYNHFDMTFPRESKHCFGECSPAKMRLSTNPTHKILFDTDAGAMIKIIRRPVNLTYFALAQSHHRTRAIKIIKGLRVDAREFLAQQLIDEITNRRRGRGARVAPTGKGQYQHWITQCWSAIKA